MVQKPDHGTWTKEIEGVVHERPAFTASEAVHFQFDGWVRKSEATAAADNADAAKAPKK